jgi:hypothetical protein
MYGSQKPKPFCPLPPVATALGPFRSAASIASRSSQSIAATRLCTLHATTTTDTQHDHKRCRRRGQGNELLARDVAGIGDGPTDRGLARCLIGQNARARDAHYSRAICDGRNRVHSTKVGCKCGESDIDGLATTLWNTEHRGRNRFGFAAACFPDALPFSHNSRFRKRSAAVARGHG